MRTSAMPHRICAVLSALATCWLADVAAGAEAGGETSAERLEEIVVTAQKREQSAQDVPISLFAIDGAELERNGINGLQDLGRVVAGLEVVGGSPGVNQISLRGVTNLAGGIESTAAVGYYVDEVPVSSYSNEMPEIALWDLDRVEVLRGPQGTLFGEGSMAGTIRILANKPDATQFAARFGANVASTSLSGTSYGARGLINVPVVEDRLALRLVASYKDDDGWNDVPDLDIRNANTIKQTDARLSARWKLSEALTVDASYVLHKLDTGDAFRGTSRGVFDPNSINPAVGSVGKLTPVDTQFNIANATIDYDLGPASLISSSSYFHQNIFYSFDYDPYVQLILGPGGTTGALIQDERANVFTEELRLVSNGDNRLDWTIGGVYNDAKRHIYQRFNFDATDFFGPGLDLVDRESTAEDAKTTSWGVFGQGDYQLTDTFAAQLGMRYYEDDRDHSYLVLTDSVIFGETAGTLTFGGGKAHAVTPKAGLSWAPNKDVLAFVTAARGFRGGGTNSNASLSIPSDPIPDGFKGEFMWSYEIGVKSNLSDTVALNSYVYYNDWTDLQLVFLSQGGLFAFTSNAGSARSIGSELELAVSPSRRLNTRFSASYVDAKIAETVTDPFLGVLAQKGNRIPFSPKWKASLSGDYTVPVSERLNAVFRGNYSYHSSYFSDAANDPALENPSYGLLGLSAGVENERWSIELFGDNVTDSERTTYRNYGRRSAGIINYSYLRPRTVGIRFDTRF